MGWREADRLADVAFGEVALQATYAFRQGNPVPPKDGKGMVARSRRRVTQSKTLIAVLITFLNLGAATLLRLGPAARVHLVPATMPNGLYQAGVLTGLFGVEVALLWWTGIQVVPTLVASGAIAVLEPLPIDRTMLRRIAALVFLRLFDLPAAVVLVGTPLVVGLALGPWAGVAAVPACLSAVAFALALSLLTSRFFVRRIQGTRAGGGGTLLRWAYLLLWLLPAFGLITFATASPPFFRALATLAPSSGPASSPAFLALYPLSLAVWPPIAAGGGGALDVGGLALAIAAAAGAGYTALAGISALWLYRAVPDVGAVPPRAPLAGPGTTFALRPQRPPWAVLTKDLRLASRTPGYAFLILLPLLDSVALGFVTYAGAPGTAAAGGIALGAVVSAALLATFFAPAFFALEVIAQSYGRTLPIASRTMALGKVTLVGAIYLAAGGIVLAITAARIPAPLLFVTFVAAELPAVVAAGLLELTILFRWARSRGLPVTNLYAGTWNVLLAAVPGVAVAVAPLLTFPLLGVAGMAAVALVELAAVAPLVLARRAS